MKTKILTLTELLAMIISTPIVLASSVYTKVNVSNASVYVKQAAGNETFEIEVKNGTAVISANTSENMTNFSVNATGEGELEANITGDYEVNATVDNKSETYSGTGVFSGVYEFFNGILFSGWSIFSSIISGIFKVNV